MTNKIISPFLHKKKPVSPEKAAHIRQMSRARSASIGGYAPPPHEKDCQPYPEDGCCQLCRHKHPQGRRLSLEHNHANGYFRGWVCGFCNNVINHIEERIGLDLFVYYLTNGITAYLKEDTIGLKEAALNFVSALDKAGASKNCP